VLDFQNLTVAKPLIILDLANNHDGSLAHGKRILEEIHQIDIGDDYNIAIKFQYRDLPNFVHQDYRLRRDIKYVNRFLSTRLSWEEYFELKNYAQELGFLVACTPFDEFSVSKVVEHNYDILKIASVSFTDWSLLEEIVKIWNGPIVASTAGASLGEIERVVSFLTNRNKSFALMHCVASYPTDNSDLILSRISTLKSKFPKVPIGYSTHENPNNFDAASIALAAGAVLLERHVGSEDSGHVLNKYSSNWSTLESWFAQLGKAIEMIGPLNQIDSYNEVEKNSLKDLRRYAFAKNNLEVGHALTLQDVFFAIPGREGQLSANDLSKYRKYIVSDRIEKDHPILLSHTRLSDNLKLILHFRNSILELFKNSRVSIPKNALLELSHHYGLENFTEIGCSMITIVNREYCKKLIVLLPGQRHPAMFHKIKDETFFLAYGDLELKLDHKLVEIGVGDTVSIAPNVIHEFSSKNGAVIEEISSNHQTDDSFYLDENILSNKSRKSFISYWT
jgi:N-acetylneuraminate synthase